MDPLTCLAVAIFFEARGESITGKEAVANVIINRVGDKRYPNTICEVVWEPKAFSFTHDGMHDNPELYKGYQDKVMWEVSKNVANDVLCGKTLGLTSTHFHTTGTKPFWAKHYKADGRIGNHIFYTNETKYK